MRPILVGYTNPSHQPDSDDPDQRRPISLSMEDFNTHIHGVGATRSGKSKWLENFCRSLVRERCGFLLIDPQGALSESLRSYLAYRRPFQKIIYFDPSRSDFLVPFNPFRHDETTEISTRVSKQVDATIRAWGMENTDATPRLSRWLHCIFYLLSSGEFTMSNVSDLLQWSAKDLISYACSVVKTKPEIRNEWQSLLGANRTEFENQIESAKNKLFRFLLSPSVKRMMSIDKPSLDFGEVFRNGVIVIANLQESDSFSRESARILGTLMINDLWAAARQEPPSRRPRNPYFLLIDEVQEFITPDIREILDRGAGKGLHLGVFHQHLRQFEQQDPWSFASIRTNARTKIVFGGLGKEDALMMVDDLFINDLAYDEIKFVIEQTKFWPVYSRDVVRSRGQGSGAGRISTAGIGSGFSWDPTMEQFVEMGRTSSADSSSSHSTWQEGESDVPIFFPIPFKEVSSIQTYTLEEQRNRLADRLIEQYQRHYFIRRPGQRTIAAVTPFVDEFRVFPKSESEYLLERLIKPYALSVEEIDERIERQTMALRQKATAAADPPEPEEYLEE